MATFSDITAVILAGGLGTRLQTVVPDQPKVLAQVQGRPFITYLLDQLADAGSKRVVLSTGYRADQIEEALGHSYAKMSLLYSKEDQPLGTAGGLRLALPFLQSDPVLVLNGDSICRADLQEMWRWHVSKKAAATIMLAKVPDVQRYGQVQLDDNDSVIRFEEKGSVSGPGWINAGIYLLPVSMIEKIPAEHFVSLERDIFPKWIGQGFSGFVTNGSFLDIGTPESYRAASEFFGTLQK